LPRDIGTQDELKRANERPSGKIRVKESDEEDARSEELRSPMNRLVNPFAAAMSLAREGDMSL
jgi:hypothetical protein